jgi:hypothetical protein
MKMLSTAIRAFRRKLKEHRIGKEPHNRHIIPLIYTKCLLGALPRWFDSYTLQKPIPTYDPYKSPVFILGHWRSGTTFLQFLLNQDPGFKTPNKYESLFPDGFYTTEHILKPIIDRLLALTKPVSEWQQHISKSMDIDSPSEAELALISQLFPYTYHWAHIFPTWWAYYFHHYLFLEDLSEEAYHSWLYQYGYFLKKLYQFHANARLLIKNPGDTARVGDILKIFPKARFIFIHRNPYEVYSSNHRLWNHTQSSFSLEQISENEQDRLILQLYKRLHSAYFHQKTLLNNNQLVEIAYEDLMAKPEATLKQVYSQLQLPGFQEALPYFHAYLNQNITWKKHHYSFAPQAIKRVRHHWSFAFQAWGYHYTERA